MVAGLLVGMALALPFASAAAVDGLVFHQGEQRLAR
jgi:hypothetical protein